METGMSFDYEIRKKRPALSLGLVCHQWPPRPPSRPPLTVLQWVNILALDRELNSKAAPVHPPADSATQSCLLPSLGG